MLRPGDGPDGLLALRSSDGTILAELELRAPDGAPFSPTAIAYDPAAPWVYVAGEVPRDTLRLPALLVLERPSFRPVALVRTAPDQAFGRFLPYDGLRVVPAPLEGAVFVVMEHLIYEPPQVPTVVYRFDRVR